MWADLIGVTAYTPQQIGALTYPQLQRLLRNRGRILWPRLAPQLNALFANVSDTPSRPGELSGVEKINREYDDLKRGIQAPQTPAERRRARAYRIQHREYLGDPDRAPPGQPVQQAAQPYPGMGQAEARAIVAYAQGHRARRQAGELLTDIWETVADAYPAIWAAAGIKAGGDA